MLSLTTILCPFGGTLEHADISYNDLTGITFEAQNITCMTPLKYIDLSHNLIIDMDADVSIQGLKGLFAMVFIRNVKEFHYSHQWDLGTTSATIWQDDNSTLGDVDHYFSEDIHNNNIRKEPSMTDMLSKGSNIISALEDLFDQAFQYIQQCVDITWTSFIICSIHIIPFDDESICSFAECLVANVIHFNRSRCVKDTGDYMENLLAPLCNMPDCYKGYPIIAFPAQVQHADVSNIYTHYKISTYSDFNLAEGEKAICIDKHNNLEYLDFSSLHLHLMHSGAVKHAMIKGLTILKTLELSDNQLTFQNPALLHDMPNLEEVHIGGNDLLLNSSTWPILFNIT